MVLDPQNRKYIRQLPLGATEILALFNSSQVVFNIPFQPPGGEHGNSNINDTHRKRVEKPHIVYKNLVYENV